MRLTTKPATAAAVVLALAIAPTPASPASPAAGGAAARARDCSAPQLRAAFTILPFSNGAGHVSYTLTVIDRASTACRLHAPLSARLIGRHGRILPSNITSAGSRYTLTIPARGFAQATTRFSPDVNGKGEPGSPCEPVAVDLQITLANRGVVTAPMDPTSVCEHGSMRLSRFTVPAGSSRPCRTRNLIASFRQFSRGSNAYILALRNLASDACYVNAIARLQLRDGDGRALPTNVIAGVRWPYAIPAGAAGAATAFFSRGGHCDRAASRVLVDLGVGGPRLSVPVTPPVRACRRGRIELTGLYPSP
jgi:hypothetical protein